MLHFLYLGLNFMTKTLKLIILVVSTTLVLGACSSTANKPTLVKEKDDLVTRVFNPYRPDIVQGNVISKDLLESIRPGMSKDQVKAILGTPLLNDIFHVNRWDYVFLYRKGDSKDMQQRRVTLTFEGTKLAKIDADALPNEKDLILEIDAIRNDLRKADR
jgi:outer membrane protein assembly factor BamE